MANTNAVPQGLFGPGILFLKRTDLANQTPVNIGKCAEFSYDLSATPKDLFGQNQFPLLTAIGEFKAAGKIKAATISGIALNAAMFGDSFVAGQLDLYTSPAAVPIPVTPFTITPVWPDTGTFDTDLGVINAVTGLPLTYVSAAPAAGQYTQTAGAYLFAAADNVAGVTVKINAAYKHTAAGGQSLIVTNKLIGTTPTFQIDYRSILYGASYYVRIFNAVATKLALAHKLTDFAMPEIDFGMFANAQDQLVQFSFANAA